MKNRIGGYTLVSLSLIDLALASAGVVYVDGLGERLHAIGDKPVILTDIVVSNEKKKPTPVQVYLELDYEEAEDEESEPTPIYKATIKGVYGYTIYVVNDAVETEAEKDALELEDEISDLQEGKANIVHIDWEISESTTMTQAMFDEIKDADIIVDVESYRWIVVHKSEDYIDVVKCGAIGEVTCAEIFTDDLIINFTSNFEDLNGKQDEFIAPFSSSETYATGDYVVYDGKLYKASTDVQVAGDFDPSEWTEVTPAQLDNANVQSGTKLYRANLDISIDSGSLGCVSPITFLTYNPTPPDFTRDEKISMTTNCVSIVDDDSVVISEIYYRYSTGEINIYGADGNELSNSAIADGFTFNEFTPL